jgi:CDGSH-type Zn-finger protein
VPTVLELEPGTYYWCACGRSAKQPFCDGSHAGTGFKPKAFTVDAPKRVALCNCKQTGNGPFCDGSHKRL